VAASPFSSSTGSSPPSVPSSAGASSAGLGEQDPAALFYI